MVAERVTCNMLTQLNGKKTGKISLPLLSNLSNLNEAEKKNKQSYQIYDHLKKSEKGSRSSSSTNYFPYLINVKLNAQAFIAFYID